MAGIKYTEGMGKDVLNVDLSSSGGGSTDTSVGGGSTDTSVGSGKGWDFFGTLFSGLFSATSNVIVAKTQADAAERISDNQSLWQRYGLKLGGNPGAGNGAPRQNNSWIWIVAILGIGGLMFFLIRRR